MKLFLRFLAAVIVFIFLHNYHGYAQSYGLQFAASEVVQEQRTGLDLTPRDRICLEKDFELSFDLGFVPGKLDYFGYIVRIIDAKKQNIDLIFDRDASSKKPLKLAVGETYIEFPHFIDKRNYFKGWLNIKIGYSRASNLLTMIAGGKRHSFKLNTPLDDCLNILYGANTFDDFKTTDVPPIRLRNIEIRSNNKLSHQWLLDNLTGNEVKDLKGGNMALITNPHWIKQMHMKWQKKASFQSRGPVSAAFDAANDLVYIVSSDSLFTVSVSQDKVESLAYHSGPQNLLLGNQSYFDEKQHKLFNIHIDQKIISVYDSVKRQWNENCTLPDPLTNYWHYNKMYIPQEHAFYLFGGYGHFTYKNTIQKFELSTGTTSLVKPAGDFFTPRYLAGLGPAKNGVYIIGGYGSNKGKQILKSHHIYDLLYYDRIKNTFKKIYELKPEKEDFVFANSIIVEEGEESYYGLIFQKDKFKSALQLVKGSLIKPIIQPLGNEVDFPFQDITSYADLFYSKRLSKFIAVSLYIDGNNISHINLYSLSTPALQDNASVAASTGYPREVLIIMIVSALVLVAVIFLLWKKSQKQKLNYEPTKVDPPAETAEINRTPLASSEPAREEPRHVNAIYLFGDFQAFDRDGTDITKQFSPLIKELFLILLLHNLRWKRGISSEKLRELLWPDKNNESASNNRSVNITKLKALLEHIDDCVISNDTGTWTMIINHHTVYIDYYEYLNLIKENKTLDQQQIDRLATITQRGNILGNLNYEWLDAFKSETANKVTGTFLNFANSLVLHEQPELIIQIVSYIFNFDQVNEDAMILKCRALVQLGKHSLAKASFENFRQEYKAIYNEEFERSFKTVLK